MRILVVEDEKGIAGFIRDGLQEEGFAVDVAHDGAAGLEMALSNDYDVILLDWMLPKLSGIEVCRQVRKAQPAVPIIFLTARDTVQDTVFGLDVGASDYIRKPLQFDELMARLRVQLRGRSGGETVLRVGDVVLDPATHKVFRGVAEITLAVVDHGVGISREHLPRIFERFYRVDESRNAETSGAGLGLAIVRRLVELQHLSIHAESDPGKGTTVTLTFPAA